MSTLASAPAAGTSAAETGAAPARPGRGAGPVLALIGVAVFANGLFGPFLFDDASFALDAGFSLQNRPVVRATIALNRWLSATQTIGYHALNVAVHVAAALLLYGLVRRTLERLARPSFPAAPFAFAVALLWMVHPLQTESVSYISQRAESIAGLCYLAALYAFARSTTVGANSEGANTAAWRAAVLAALALGMGTKEIVATAPAVLFLYDRCFVAGSFRAALRARGGFHALVAGVTLALAAWFIGPLLFGADTSGFALESVSAAQYARSQPGVILHYLALCFVPRGQCLDLMWPIAAEARDVVPQALVLAALLALTLWALWRRPALGFAGAWFFLMLAPSSSFVPIQDLAVEHRMYLALAGVVVVVLAALWRLAARLAPRQPEGALITALALAAALALVSVRRNVLYQDSVEMWTDVVAKSPHNWRAHLSLGMALLDHGTPAPAAAELERSLELGPRPNTYLYLGRAYSRMGEHDKALRALDEADRLRPLHAETLLDRGIAYLRKGDPRAVADLERSAALEPTGVAFFNLGVAALNAGQAQLAERHFRRALELLPDSPQSLGGLGRALYLEGRFADAAHEFEHALQFRRNDTELKSLLEACRSAAPGG